MITLGHINTLMADNQDNLNATFTNIASISGNLNEVIAGEKNHVREIVPVAAHEMLDHEEAMERLCPECRTRAEEARCSICGAKLGETAGGGNASFDMARFIRMKEGRKP